MTAAAIIVAAGKGNRFGDPGKSFTPVCGLPLAQWSLRSALASPSVEEVVLVCGSHSLDAAQAMVASAHLSKPVEIVLGGARRQDSALIGIKATSAHIEITAIHDAARPLVDAALFEAVISAAARHGAAIAAIPVSDTIKRIRNEHVVETVSRDDLVSVQTPQAFQKSLILSAFLSAEGSGISVTDEASLIEAFGGTVHVVRGFPENMKVTYPGDLALVEALLRARKG